MISKTVDIWWIPLDREGEDARLRPLLDAREKARADRFHRDRDRRRYTVARGMLRTILGETLGIRPTDVAFRYGPQGKPSIEGNPFHFNLAHSNERAVLAIAKHGPIGIDLEYWHGLRDFDGIVGRFFTEGERQVYGTLPESLRQEAFFRGWTGKEAYLKATGLGLAGPLESVEVEIDPRRPACLRLLGDFDPVSWSLQEIDPGYDADYRGAIVAEGAIRIVIQSIQ
ncbi:MAG: 4'-phosphopantetheinyl transferase superfamily protein [Isosphaeraceae bacterium]